MAKKMGTHHLYLKQAQVSFCMLGIAKPLHWLELVFGCPRLAWHAAGGFLFAAVVFFFFFFFSVLMVWKYAHLHVRWQNVLLKLLGDLLSSVLPVHWPVPSPSQPAFG
ncbi:hypothetical protein [Pseudomonas gregormendelii]